MTWLLAGLSEDALYAWESELSVWVFLLSLAILALELLRYLGMKRFGWPLIGDALANFVSLGFYLTLGYLLYGALYLTAYVFFHQFALFDISLSWATVFICVLLADLAYYWEHRCLHRVGVAWATHTVHHSSPHFNLSVAYRFGPMDDFWPFFFHLPLVLVGFNPFVVFFAEVFVQLYQTFLHTEVIGKLPRPVEAVFNTPSHHRVHHGSNPQYRDKNYGGILIVWDRLFGTYAEERETVVYGITEPLNSVTPLKVFFHGLTRLWSAMRTSSGVKNTLAVLSRPPDWQPVVVRAPVAHQEERSR